MRRTAGRLLAALAGAAVALLLAEAVLRVTGVWVGRHSDTMFSLLEHDENLGWRMKRNFDGRVDLVDVEGVPVRTNAAGFWDDEHRLVRDDARCRLLFLGDSFTWGLGVLREERFTDLVGQATGWEALNFGVPGFGADQSLLLWELEGMRHRPHVVVLTVYANDYADGVHEVRYGRPKPYLVLAERGGLSVRGVPVGPVTFWQDGVFNRLAPPYAGLSAVREERRSPLAHWLVKNSDAVRLLYTSSRAAMGLLRPAPSLEDRARSAPVAVPLEPLAAAEVSLLVGSVARLHDGAQSEDIPLLVVLAGPASPLHAAAAERLRGVGVAVVDATTDALIEAAGGAPLYLPYSGHWTPAAHRAAAEQIARAVRGFSWCGERP